MELNDYHTLAQRTSNTQLLIINKIRNGCYGLNGEAGECIDILKKHEFQGHALDTDKLIDELGDVLWYIVETAGGLGITLEDVAKRNIDKLRKRYPEGFNIHNSINREE